MPEKRQNREEQLRCSRLGAVLARLADQGITQRQAAVELNVPPQYLSDVKNGHRSFTEQFARRIAERCGVSFVWLMSGEGAMGTPRLNAGGVSQTDALLLLPVLSKPTSGDPTESSAWDGSTIALSAAAVAMAARALRPYVLRVANDDVNGRLQQHDHPAHAAEGFRGGACARGRERP